jgi:hypothetical protein
MHFSMNFWANFTDLLDVSLDQLGNLFTEGVSIKTIRALVYSAILAHDQEEGNEVDYNEFKVGVWLEDFDADQINEVVNVMMESRILGNDLNAGIDRNIKNTTKKGK